MPANLRCNASVVHVPLILFSLVFSPSIPHVLKGASLLDPARETETVAMKDMTVDLGRPMMEHGYVAHSLILQ